MKPETVGIQQLKNFCEKNAIQLDGRALILLQRYAELLVDWNAKVNLVSRNDIQNVWQNHILHSLSIFSLLRIEAGIRVLDLGTGGGLPGIPISIVRDDLKITLLDSIQKKTAAVQNMVDSLALSNVEVITGRAEEIAKKNNEGWDVVISRAVAPLVQLIEWSKPLLKHPSEKKIHDSENRMWETPLIVALKGGDLENEIQEAKKKWHPTDIQVFDINLDRTEPREMQNKKIVLVKL